jgi:DNA-directed RNA polymerase specialized sigma24 family protein
LEDIISFFENSLTEYVEEVTGFLSNKYDVYEEKDEYRSAITLRLLENKHKILSSFKGRSSVKTYLSSIIIRYFIDIHRSAVGRWRPSAVARSYGELGVEIERFYIKERWSPLEIYRKLYGNKYDITYDYVAELCSKLPVRHGYKKSDIDLEIISIKSSENNEPETSIFIKASEVIMKEALNIVKEVIEKYRGKDKLALSMYFNDNMMISKIAAALDMKRHYVDKLIKDVMAEIRAKLKEKGINKEDIDDILK